jgi:hypothetical protein
VVLTVFAILAVAPFAYHATQSSFWEPEHSMAPFATLIDLGVVTALVVGCRRWAWFLLTLLYAWADIGWVFASHRFETRTLLFLAVNVGTLALLVSPPMRRRLKRPVDLRHIAGARLQS